MNVSSALTKDYENDNTFRLPENKPNSKPIQSLSNPIQTQYHLLNAARHSGQNSWPESILTNWCSGKPFLPQHSQRAVVAEIPRISIGFAFDCAFLSTLVLAIVSALSSPFTLVNSSS